MKRKKVIMQLPSIHMQYLKVWYKISMLYSENLKKTLMSHK